MARQIRIEYTTCDQATDMTCAEQGMALLGRQGDFPWIFNKLRSLSDGDVLFKFKEWPGLRGPEGAWGTITLGLYVLMCQLYIPKLHEWRLGEEGILKVDLIGNAEDIRRLLASLAQP
jgi:hypothetical protein